MGLGIIISLGLYLFRKRRSQDYQEAGVNGSTGMALPPRMLEQRHAEEMCTEQQWELSGNVRTELNGNARSELDGSGRSEMEARWRIGW